MMKAPMAPNGIQQLFPVEEHLMPVSWALHPQTFLFLIPSQVP